MWNDNETALDLISINHYISSVVELVNDDTLLPLTVGIFGDWGNGKSSLLKMVKEQLDKQDKTLCLYFNGWLFEDYDDAKAALIGTILDEIEKNPTLSTRAKGVIKTLRERVNWLGLMGVAGKYGLSTLLGGPAGGLAALSIDAGKQIIEKIKSGEVDDIKKLVNPTVADSSEVRKNIREFRDEFADLLKESKIDKLVVIIDDLDRCLPDTIINTLEAIKLFLSSENTAFLISIDERVIKHAINHRYSNFDPVQKDEISRDYLEKLIQIPLRLPLMSRNEMKSYINLLFASKHMTNPEFQTLLGKVNESRKGNNFNISLDFGWFSKNGKVSDELKDELMIAEQINDLLYDFLKGNPRQVKRFINALLLRMKLARLRGVDLKKQLLAKLMALEYMHIGYFRQLADWQSVQNGKPTEIIDLEAKVKEEKERKVPDGQADWLQKEWLSRWLKAEPYLTNENLEPYFYISRDSITYFVPQALVLTENEKLVFDDLLATAATHRNRGKKSFEQLSDTEAINISNALIEKSRKIDFQTNDTDLLLTITSLINTKAVVAEAIIDFIALLDDAYIQPAIVLELKTAQKKATSALSIKISELLNKFKMSKNTMLAKAVDS